MASATESARSARRRESTCSLNVQKGPVDRSRGARHTLRGQTNMWRYQTQQDHAAIHGVGVESSLWTSSAWKSANEAFDRVDSEPTTVRPQSPGGCWTQPCQHRWQRSGLMSSCQSTGLSSRCYLTSAHASYSSQSAQAGYTKHPLLETWAACQCHVPPQSQQPTQFDHELTAAISFAFAPDTEFISGDHGMLHEEQDQDLIQMQQLGLEDSPQLSGSLPLVCSPALKSEPCSEAAARDTALDIDTAMWADNGASQDALPEEVLHTRASRQLPSLNVLTPKDLPSSLKVAATASTLDSSFESQCCISEDDSTPDSPLVEQPKAKARKKKADLGYITVAYLQKHHYFDMPLVEAAASLGIGLSAMKRHCRDLGLARWPYRMRSSLRAVIKKTEKYLADTQHQDQQGFMASGQKADVLEALESHMQAVTGAQGGADLYSDSIKKYRQSIFKLNYKLKKTKQNQKARHRIAVPPNAAERVLTDQKQDVVQ